MPEEFPETTLRTERLILRPFGGADIEDVQRGCADEATQRWIPLPSPYTLADAGSWCITRAHALRESGDGIHFAVVDAGTDRLLPWANHDCRGTADVWHAHLSSPVRALSALDRAWRPSGDAGGANHPRGMRRSARQAP